jgi:hypothetical protein
MAREKLGRSGSSFSRENLTSAAKAAANFAMPTARLKTRSFKAKSKPNSSRPVSFDESPEGMPGNARPGEVTACFISIHYGGMDFREGVRREVTSTLSLALGLRSSPP